LAAISGTGFHIMATDAQGGAWSNFVVGHGLIPGGANFQAPDGSLEFCGVGQEWPPLGSNPIGTNPLPDLWSAVWTPATFGQRLVSFELMAIRQGNILLPPRLFVRTGADPNGNPLYGLADGLAHYDSVQIPVIPAPGAGAMMGLGLALIQGRRRRSLAGR